MSRIAFLAPDDNMFEKASEAFQGVHSDILIEKGLLSQGVTVATSLVGTGTEVIITRGGTASAIKDSGLEVIVVEVPVTGFDIIRTTEKAKLHGKRIGAVAFPSMILGINCLCPILGVDIRLYPIDHEFEAEAQVLRAFQEGADSVIGGVITAKTAKKHNLPCVPIESGIEGILQAAQEAKRIAYARKLEQTKTNLFRAVLDYAYEGIISIDNEYCITFFNPIAQRITGIDGARATGKKISDIWPELNLEQVIRTGKDDIGQILKINEIDVLCNKVAIIVSSNVVGVVVTFQDVNQIQQMDARVRRRIYDSGHIASFCFTDIEKTGPGLQQTIKIAKDFSLTHSSILILGETGTGKEVFAQSIHNYSSRNQGPFVAINCAALPGQILESELFGYVGGAFTSANPKGKPGLFEVAHDGTIFLDEIAEMDYATQGKLLRVLQEKKVMRLGSDRVVPIDVRIIAATNKDLKQLVIDNKFRADLYYRLNVLQLRIAPLRNRKEDIRLLAEFFLREHAGIIKRHLKLAPSALKVLVEYSWPGNIRELKNLIERVIAVYKQETIDADIIRLMLEDQQDDTPQTRIMSNESEEISKALILTKGKYTEAAKILGMSRSTLWRKLKRFGIKYS
jgi:PAS domain S-box-containing protein